MASRKRRLCIVCKERPAQRPLREGTGRPIKRVCEHCHDTKLRSDLHKIMANVLPKRRR